MLGVVVVVVGVDEVVVVDVTGGTVAVVDDTDELVDVVGLVVVLVKESSRKHNRDILDLENCLTSRNVDTTDDDHTNLIASQTQLGKSD